MKDKTIFLSVAHSAKSPGAVNSFELLEEYMISVRASLAAYRRLTSNGIPCVLSDCGWLDPDQYSKIKPLLANAINPSLAIEIHCNSSSDPGPNYCEAIYLPGSVDGEEAAMHIVDGFRDEWKKQGWTVHGARANSISQDLHMDFWLTATKCPAVIVEGLFISNPDQAIWLAQHGAEEYGLKVADGVMKWISFQS